MKTYFNTEERNKHIICLCMSEVVKEFAKSTALTEEERENLESAVESVQRASNSILERMGLAYARKISGTLDANTVRVVGKYGMQDQKFFTYFSQEDLVDKISEVINFHCMDCDKECYKECPVYNLAITCEVEGHNDSGCPYKW